MNVSSVLNAGLQGIQKGQEGLAQAADEIVNSATQSGGGNIIEPIVDLKLYEQSVEASAKVVKTADEVLGTLLDTLA